MKFLVFVLLFFGTRLFADQTTFLFVRHGQTNWNVEKKIQGSTDNPLNNKGREQARTTAKNLKALYPHVDAFYSSNLQRANTTAQIIAKAYGSTGPIERKPCFDERCSGITEGQHVKDCLPFFLAEHEIEALKKQYPNLGKQWNAPVIPGAETFDQVKKRALNGLHALAQAHPNQTVVIATHGTLMKILFSSIQKCTLKEIGEVPNCAIFKVTYKAEEDEVIDKLSTFFALDTSRSSDQHNQGHAPHPAAARTKG